MGKMNLFLLSSSISITGHFQDYSLPLIKWYKMIDFLRSSVGGTNASPWRLLEPDTPYDLVGAKEYKVETYHFLFDIKESCYVMIP